MYYYWDLEYLTRERCATDIVYTFDGVLVHVKMLSVVDYSVCEGDEALLVEHSLNVREVPGSNPGEPN